jgi:hypothetical protein
MQSLAVCTVKTGFRDERSTMILLCSFNFLQRVYTLCPLIFMVLFSSPGRPRGVHISLQ